MWLIACGRVGFDPIGPGPGSDAVSDGALATWPNEPTGFSVETDQPWDALASLGWRHNPCSSRIVTDPAAPRSPSSVLEVPFPTGFTGGGAGCIDFFGVGLTEVYFAFWWQVSSPWQAPSTGLSSVSSIAGNTTGGMSVYLAGDAAPYHVLAHLEMLTSNGHIAGSTGDDPGFRFLPANVADPEVELGTWHLIEVHLRHSTTETSRDGLVRWWVDGVPSGSHANVNTPSVPYVEFRHDPTWGATGDTKTEDDFIRFDHVRISAP